LSFVLDCSATLAAVLPDEADPVAAALFDRVAEEGVHVPSLWWLEVANALNSAIRRKRIDVIFRDQTLADLGALDVRTDIHTASRAWVGTLRLADTQRLTLYDAAYLELAHRLSLPLATFDVRLRAAAKAISVPLIVA
jgi:predicted nucleic acid-binding protein